MNIPLFYDVTLRDGSHANRHSFTKEFCLKYIRQAYASGIRYIEIGHGNGIGGSSLQIGELLEEDLLNVISELRNEFKDIYFGAHVIPGLAKFSDLEKVIDAGVSILRIGSHCTEADTTETYIEFAAKRNCDAWGLLMMCHMIKPDHLAREAEKMQSYGASRIVFLDSAGSLTPKKVMNICNSILSLIEIPLGFHAHNNLHAAVANSFAAIDNGCTSIDACSRGYGAGAGNLSLESLVGLLELDGIKTGLEFRKLMDLSLLMENYFRDSLPIVDVLSTATGYHGLFSGFKKKVIEAAQKFKVSPTKLIEKLGEDNVIAGQEDQIIEAALELVNKTKD